MAARRLLGSTLSVPELKLPKVDAVQAAAKPPRPRRARDVDRDDARLVTRVGAPEIRGRCGHKALVRRMRLRCVGRARDVARGESPGLRRIDRRVENERVSPATTGEQADGRRAGRDQETTTGETLLKERLPVARGGSGDPEIPRPIDPGVGLGFERATSSGRSHCCWFSILARHRLEDPKAVRPAPPAETVDYTLLLQQ